MFAGFLAAMFERNEIKSSLVSSTGNLDYAFRDVTYPNHPDAYARLDKSKLMDVDYFNTFQTTMFLLVLLGIIVYLLAYYYWNGSWDRDTALVSETTFCFFLTFFIILTVIMLFMFYWNTKTVPYWK